jgi:hypothetical protein
MLHHSPVAFSLRSIHGKTRIYHHAYFEHPNYAPLTQNSTREFFALQKRHVGDCCEENTNNGRILIKIHSFKPAVLWWQIIQSQVTQSYWCKNASM